MRSAGFTLTALLVAGSAGWAQPPAVPGAPVAPPPAAQPKADPKLDAYLLEWEKKMAGVINFRTEVTLARTDAVFKKTTTFGGPDSVVLCMKPNYAVLRLNNTGDPTKTDYEAYICDGKAVYAYNGVAKTITAFKIPKAGAGVDNLMIDFLSGMKAKDVKERFDIALFKTDENYIYLDIKPLLGKDQREFKHLRLALYGPGANTAKFAYLPAQVYMLKPNDDVEVWKFANTQVDIPGVEAKHFQFVDIKGWKVLEAPPAPVGNSGTVPAGGAVRPGKP
ncbi:TIGR03009 domain-containing protein [Gemmata sp. G18]|uniref:TIGR03009 domain-containing protein n=1 Tax=Gemmata palustris TaxID=2822762 RepID=A0ABS5BSY1_9BACT|nr:TIGR03009 domain-containing protein [Gemmata palustris]MBP3956838.1 TIGR03009 domain-containing protein [Gemmata palustris]